MTLKDTILQKIKEELQTDPTNVGYTSMTLMQKLQAINTHVERQVTTMQYDIPPISRILSGLANASNSVELADIVAALAQT